eukprot:6490875-Amphidinium_carterae.1
MNLGCGAREGLVIHHQCHDRGITSEFRDCVSGFWRVHTEEFCQEGGLDSGAEDLKHWHVSVGCAIHDCHNSLRWGWESACSPSSQVLKDMYVVVQVFRQCLVGALPFLAEWLGGVLKPVERGALPDASELAQLYGALGLHAVAVTTLSEEMGLYWDESASQMMVSSEYLAGADSIEQLTACLVELWHFPAFTTSRWATVGVSCRKVLAGVFTGYKHFLERAKKGGFLSDYISSGLDKCDAGILRFAAVAGLVSYVPDSMLNSLLLDSRLLRKASELEEELYEEFDYIEGLEVVFWERFAGTLGCKPVLLRNDVLAGCFAALSYLHQRVFTTIAERPFALCVGDVSQNLDALLDEPVCPQESISSKIWCLHQAGYGRDRLEDGLLLLQSISFSSHFTERQHGSTACVHRFHPAYGQLLPDTQKASGCETRLVKRIEKLQRKQPDRITGRHVYVGTRLSRSYRTGSLYANPPASTDVMRRHGEHWHRLSSGQQARYEKEAAQLRATRKEAIQNELSALRRQLQGERESVREDTLECSDSMVISACKWTPQLLNQFDAFLRSGTLTPAVLADLRTKSRTCPPKSAPDVIKRYREKSQISHALRPRLSNTWIQIARHREYFKHAVLRLHSDGESFCLRILHIMLNPLHVAWTPLTALDLPTKPSTMLRGDDEMGLRDPVHAWSYECTDIRDTDPFQDVTAQSVTVCLQSLFKAKSVLISMDSPLDLVVVLEQLDRDVKPRASRARSRAEMPAEGEVELADPSMHDASASDAASSSEEDTDGTDAGNATAMEPWPNHEAVDAGTGDAIDTLFEELELHRTEAVEREDLLLD